MQCDGTPWSCRCPEIKENKENSSLNFQLSFFIRPFYFLSADHFSQICLALNFSSKQRTTSQRGDGMRSVASVRQKQKENIEEIAAEKCHCGVADFFLGGGNMISPPKGGEWGVPKLTSFHP